MTATDPRPLVIRDAREEDLDAVALFFDVEAGPLARARAATGYAAYPVPQAERDLLFTEVREAAARARSAG